MNSGHMEINGGIVRRTGTLSIYYELSGPPGVLSIPAPAVSPARKNDLWEETCFEFFLAEKDAEAYWEFNISPTGDWNVYCFTSYRQGMKEASAFSSLPMAAEAGDGSLLLSLEIDLEKIKTSGKPLDIGISAVVKTPDCRKIYWSLAHAGPRADFHRRDSFVLSL